MSQTLKLGLPYLLPNQAQKHVTYNSSLSQLDSFIQMTILSEHPNAPPDMPEEGLTYILSSDVDLDEWPVGRANDIVLFADGAWQAVSPLEGWSVYDLSSKQRLVFGGQAWHAESSLASMTQADHFGVNTDADDTNRLAVKSDAELLTHDDVTPGTGDAQKIINKASENHTASVVFQSAFSGMAELGLCGEDNFAIKVSSDGVSWVPAFVVDRLSGRVGFPHTPFRDVLSGDRTYYVRPDGNDSNPGNENIAASAFATIQHAIDHVIDSLDLNGRDVTIKIANGVYNEGIVVSSGQVGRGRIRLAGDVETPSNVTISSGDATCIYVTGAGSRLFVSGIKVQTNGFAGWHADAGGVIISEGRNEIGQVGAHQILAGGPSVIRMTHNLIVSGGCAGGHVHASTNGHIYTQGASWSFVGAPSFGVFFQAQSCGVIYTFANSFSGAIQGQKYSASVNGVIQTNSGANPNYLPGTSAGGVSTGGQYG